MSIYINHPKELVLSPQEVIKGTHKFKISVNERALEVVRRRDLLGWWLLLRLRSLLLLLLLCRIGDHGLGLV